MTPKEKAIQMVNTYKIANYPKLDIEECKKCALIAVDEILEWPQVHDTERVCEFSDEFYVKPSRYWTEVKQEIEKL